MDARCAPVFTEVSNLARFLEEQGSGRVVLANGCFDPLHVGHVRFLRGAAAHGDLVVVALNNDESTHKLKGEGRPVVGETDRAAVLASMEMVHAVLLFGDDTLAPILEALRPDVHANGTDFTVETVPEFDTSRRLGIETVVVGDPKSHASSRVLERIKSDDDRPGDE